MNTRLRTAVMLVIAGALTAFLAACGGSDGDKTPSAVAQPTTAATTATTPAAGGATEASIKIVSPADGWSQPGDRVEVQVQVEGLKLDGTKIGQPAAQNPGVGHWHVYVDGKYAGLSVSDVVSLPNDASIDCRRPARDQRCNCTTPTTRRSCPKRRTPSTSPSRGVDVRR